MEAAAVAGDVDGRKKEWGVGAGLLRMARGAFACV